MTAWRNGRGGLTTGDCHARCICLRRRCAMLEPSVVYEAYHESAPVWRASILREYLQLKTLQYIYGTTHGAGLVFMGGTAVHLFTGSPRFSEDLDFDNRGVSAPGFRTLAADVVRRFALDDVACDVVVKEHRGMTAVLRFTDMLQRWDLTGHRDSVLRIKVDTEPQNFDVAPERRILSHLDVFVPVLLTPVRCDVEVLGFRVDLDAQDTVAM